MTAPGAEVVVRRGGAAAAWWSLLGALLVAAGVFFVLDTDGHPLAWLVLAVFAVPAVHFWLQLAWPGAVEVRLDRDALRSRSLARRTTVPWDDVRLATVRERLGDPVLVVETRDPNGRLERTRIALPVGADLDRLHGFLAERLGRAPSRP